MTVANVAQGDADIGVSQQPGVTVLPKKSADSQFPDTSFLDLPLELHYHILREASAAEIRELKAVSKDLKRLIEKKWRPAFFILPPKIQIKILAETQMNSTDIRRMKLVSRDMKYLIERSGRHLTKQNMHDLVLDLDTPGSWKVTSQNWPRFKLNISFDDFSRVFAHCHVGLIKIDSITITLHFCEKMQKHFRGNKITCETLYISMCDCNDNVKVTAFDRLVGATGASNLRSYGCNIRKLRLEKEFFWMPSIRKLERMRLVHECDFSDDDLSAGSYRELCLERCCLSEHGLRRILQEFLDGTRHINYYVFNTDKYIDIDRLLSSLPNVESSGTQRWILRNIKGQTLDFDTIYGYYRCTLRT